VRVTRSAYGEAANVDEMSKGQYLPRRGLVEGWSRHLPQCEIAIEWHCLQPLRCQGFCPLRSLLSPSNHAAVFRLNEGD
jgi:hypothetical protein